LLYDMASDIEINLLEQWMQRIFTNATRTNSVILILGNNEHGTNLKNEKILATLSKIEREHRFSCESCARKSCQRILNGEFNLQTGSKLNEHIKKFV